jgi:DNA-binding CsgD family transcriptional regulator
VPDPHFRRSLAGSGLTELATGVTVETRSADLTGLGLDPKLESAYRGLLEHPTWPLAKLAAHLDLTAETAEQIVDRLRDLELVQRAKRGGEVRLIDPRVSLPALVARLDAELTNRRNDLAEGQLAIADLVSGMDIGRAAQGGQVEDVCWGARDIRARAAQLAAAASSEVVTMATAGSALLDPSVIAARAADGVCCRLVFADGDWVRRPVGEGFVRNFEAAGAEVRIGAVPTTALIVDSRTVALPIRDSAAGQTVGLATLRFPSAVTAVVELFERVWADSGSVHARVEVEESGLSERERDLLDLLMSGSTDDTAAYKLGVSVRTVRRMVSDLMQRLGARSRFEAGARAAEQGWLQVPVAAARAS